MTLANWNSTIPMERKIFSEIGEASPTGRLRWKVMPAHDGVAINILEQEWVGTFGSGYYPVVVKEENR